MKALYEASCPAYKEQPYIVILDEMNLSHPEQYFADILSNLEEPDEDKRVLHFHTSELTDAPKLFETDRYSLKLPKNVWFVGTANQDETTVRFADKTYDRAHVMELPSTPPQDKPAPLANDKRISYDSLMEAFKNARTTHAQEAEEGINFLNDQLKELLAKQFGIGWGNRLEKQMR